MIIHVNDHFAHLLDDATDRQKIWLAFWSYIYHENKCDTWFNLHPKDYGFMLGLSETNYMMNAICSTSHPVQNPTAKRHLGEAIAAEFEWRVENRHNVLWRSKTLSTKYTGRLSRAMAPKPRTETEITDPKAINMWCYLLGRLKGGNLATTFNWWQQGFWTISDLELDEMGQKPYERKSVDI